ncbi:hypothetical protein J6590_071289 [Homalodisca vitripennis]|nr:hypothetical protein J6590_071289 [Homalodisca vitripennis]
MFLVDLEMKSISGDMGAAGRHVIPSGLGTFTTAVGDVAGDLDGSRSERAHFLASLIDGTIHITSQDMEEREDLACVRILKPFNTLTSGNSGRFGIHGDRGPSSETVNIELKARILKPFNTLTSGNSGRFGIHGDRGPSSETVNIELKARSDPTLKCTVDVGRDVADVALLEYCWKVCQAGRNEGFVDVGRDVAEEALLEYYWKVCQAGRDVRSAVLGWATDCARPAFALSDLPAPAEHQLIIPLLEFENIPS